MVERMSRADAAGQQRTSTKPTTMRRIFLLLALLALPSASAISKPVFVLVSGPGYRGAVNVCGASRRASLSCWQPSSAAIAQLEAALAAARSAPLRPNLQGLSFPLAEYRRQYLGVFRGKERIIFFSGYHKSTSTVTTGAWLRSIVTVNGGGGWYFRGLYRPRSRTFASLGINAPA